MKQFILLLGIVFGVNVLLTAQIKRQYVNEGKNDRKEVVKEEGTNDMQILAENFADAKPGEVIRISTEKSKPKKEPKAKKEKVVVKEKKKDPPKPKVQKKRKAPTQKRTSKSRKKRSRKKVFFKKKKRKRVSKRKKYSCFQF